VPIATKLTILLVYIIMGVGFIYGISLSVR